MCDFGLELGPPRLERLQGYRISATPARQKVIAVLDNALREHLLFHSILPAHDYRITRPCTTNRVILRLLLLQRSRNLRCRLDAYPKGQRGPCGAVRRALIHHGVFIAQTSACGIPVAYFEDGAGLLVCDGAQQLELGAAGQLRVDCGGGVVRERGPGEEEDDDVREGGLRGYLVCDLGGGYDLGVGEDGAAGDDDAEGRHCDGVGVISMWLRMSMGL
jgi:hypothetical protein